MVQKEKGKDQKEVCLSEPNLMQQQTVFFLLLCYSFNHILTPRLGTADLKKPFDTQQVTVCVSQFLAQLLHAG